MRVKGTILVMVLGRDIQVAGTVSAMAPSGK